MLETLTRCHAGSAYCSSFSVSRFLFLLSRHEALTAMPVDSMRRNVMEVEMRLAFSERLELSRRVVYHLSHGTTGSAAWQ